MQEVARHIAVEKFKEGVDVFIIISNDTYRLVESELELRVPANVFAIEGRERYSLVARYGGDGFDIFDNLTQTTGRTLKMSKYAAKKQLKRIQEVIS